MMNKKGWNMIDGKEYDNKNTEIILKMNISWSFKNIILTFVIF